MDDLKLTRFQNAMVVVAVAALLAFLAYAAGDAFDHDGQTHGKDNFGDTYEYKE